MRLIDADAADVDRIHCYHGGCCYIEDVQEWLDDQPTIEAEPVRHARWNEPTGRFQDGFWICSVCDFCTEASAAPLLYKYCPNCGSMMDSEE